MYDIATVQAAYNEKNTRELQRLFKTFSSEEKFKFLVRLPDFEATRQELKGNEQYNASGQILLGLNYFGQIKELFESFNLNKKNEFLKKDFSIGNRSCKDFYYFLSEFSTELKEIIKNNEKVTRSALETFTIKSIVIKDLKKLLVVFNEAKLTDDKENPLKRERSPERIGYERMNTFEENVKRQRHSDSDSDSDSTDDQNRLSLT